jgi:hypothetical protein
MERLNWLKKKRQDLALRWAAVRVTFRRSGAVLPVNGEFVLLHFRAGPRNGRDAQNVFARNTTKIVYCLVVVPTLLQSPGDQL